MNSLSPALELNNVIGQNKMNKMLQYDPDSNSINSNFVLQQPTRPGSKAANSKRAKRNSNSSNGGGKAVEGSANMAAASSTQQKVILRIFHITSGV